MQHLYLGGGDSWDSILWHSCVKTRIYTNMRNRTVLTMQSQIFSWYQANLVGNSILWELYNFSSALNSRNVTTIRFRFYFIFSHYHFHFQVKKTKSFELWWFKIFELNCHVASNCGSWANLSDITFLASFVSKNISRVHFAVLYVLSWRWLIASAVVEYILPYLLEGL